MTQPVRVVVADDSPFVCRLLTSYLQSAPDFQVVGTALNGVRAVELVKTLRPDVVTLDLEMPELNGLQALEQIMLDCPTPVIMVSGISRSAALTTLQALNLGAVDFVLKYTPGVDTDPEELRQEIIAKVRSASQVKVIRSLRTHRPGEILPEVDARSAAKENPLARSDAASSLPGSVVIIGASTGGPVALRELLSQLPADFPAAVIIVQHIPASFTGVLAAQLNRNVPMRVKEAEAGDRLQPGLALVAPGGFHLLVQLDARIELNEGPAIGGHRPSIDVTMQSVAQLYASRVKGVVLTGMGSDGAQGLVAIRSKGGRTFAQDAKTCVVNGMPQRAIERGVVNHIGSPAEIAQLLRLEVSRS